MKHLLLAILVAGIFSACNSSQPSNTAKVDNSGLSFYGDTITPDGAVAVSELIAKLSGKDSMPIKLEGEIAEVCQKKGCWMTMAIDSVNSMRIGFKDYKFFVPKDISGKKAIVEGWVVKKMVPVEELRHYAEDAGDSKEEIEKITEPQPEYNFEAKGVIVRK